MGVPLLYLRRLCRFRFFWESRELCSKSFSEFPRFDFFVSFASRRLAENQPKRRRLHTGSFRIGVRPHGTIWLQRAWRARRQKRPLRAFHFLPRFILKGGWPQSAFLLARGVIVSGMMHFYEVPHGRAEGPFYEDVGPFLTDGFLSRDFGEKFIPRMGEGGGGRFCGMFCKSFGVFLVFISYGIK